MSSQSPRSSAEKRLLWEVRQRYDINNAPNRAVRPKPKKLPSIPKPPSAPPPVNRPKSSRPSKPFKWVRRFAVVAILLFLSLGGVFGYKIIAASNKITVAEKSILGQIKDLLFSSDRMLQGEADDRINVMLLAIGGEGHSGENLADTIMIASFRPSDKSVALLSIPRDLYVQVPGENYYSKINAVHAHGEALGTGQGPIVLGGLVTEITGLPIHYYARVDFTAFKQIVDEVGGIDITIDNSFYDYWHKIDFYAGTEHMDGERSLAYVRARYVEGPEGGDFKRAARQQQVLLALQEKIFSIYTAFDLSTINGILNSLSDNIQTNMELWEMKRFYELARDINRDNVKSVVLTTGTNGVLVGGTEVLGGVPASILKTRTGDYSEIQQIAATIFDSTKTVEHTPTSASTATPSPSTSASATPISLPTVEIRNGTNITGLAKQTSETLKSKDYTITSIGNAATRDYTKTTVYPISGTAAEAEALSELINATTDTNLPDGETKSSAEILIILGTDASN